MTAAYSRLQLTSSSASATSSDSGSDGTIQGDGFLRTSPQAIQTASSLPRAPVMSRRMTEPETPPVIPSRELLSGYGAHIPGPNGRPRPPRSTSDPGPLAGASMPPGLAMTPRVAPHGVSEAAIIYPNGVERREPRGGAVPGPAHANFPSSTLAPGPSSSRRSSLEGENGAPGPSRAPSQRRERRTSAAVPTPHLLNQSLPPQRRERRDPSPPGPPSRPQSRAQTQQLALESGERMNMAGIGTLRPPPVLPGVLTMSMSSGPRGVRWDENLICPSPVPMHARRKGWFNRRGDQLWTNEGTYRAASPGQEFPPDLRHYPAPGQGWMDEQGVRIDMRHRLVPKRPLRSALKKTNSAPAISNPGK